jgi:hypothetical protein
VELAKFVKPEWPHFVNLDILEQLMRRQSIDSFFVEIKFLKGMDLIPNGPYDGRTLPGASITPREDSEGEFPPRILTGGDEGVSRSGLPAADVKLTRLNRFAKMSRLKTPGSLHFDTQRG